MNETVKRSAFWPRGREIFVAFGLAAIVIASGAYAISQALDQVDAEAHASSSSRMPSFNMETGSIDKAAIFHGGPPKDGIPALTDPKMIKAASAGYLKPEDRVAGLVAEGKALAYPLKVLQWHEVVNAREGDVSFAVVYCPLCDSVNVFNREVDGETLEFGVSGLLYQSNVLLYDRRDDDRKESLWSQMKGEAVTGPMTGTRLDMLPAQVLSWAEWKLRYPESMVLSDQTGHARRYEGNIYQAYFDSNDLMFPVVEEDGLFPRKKPVVGLLADGEARAYPVPLLEKGVEITDSLAGKRVSIRTDEDGEVWVDVEPGVEVIHSFWFAWYSFYPHTTVYDGEAFDLQSWRDERNAAQDSSASSASFSQDACLLRPSSSVVNG